LTVKKLPVVIVAYVSAAARHEVLLLSSVTPNYPRVIEQNWMML